MTEWFVGHEFGDMVRITALHMPNEIGFVMDSPYEVQGFMFIRVYVPSKRCTYSFNPWDITIISKNEE